MLNTLAIKLETEHGSTSMPVRKEIMAGLFEIVDVDDLKNLYVARAVVFATFINKDMSRRVKDVLVCHYTKKQNRTHRKMLGKKKVRATHFYEPLQNLQNESSDSPAKRRKLDDAEAPQVYYVCEDDKNKAEDEIKKLKELYREAEVMHQKFKETIYRQEQLRIGEQIFFHKTC